MSDRQSLSLIELVLLGSGRAMTEAEIAERMPWPLGVREAIVELAQEYGDRGVQIVEVEPAKWAVRTRPEDSDLCRRLLPRPLRMSPAAMQTLAVIAYFQPVTRSDVERIRGVSLSKGTLDVLVYAGWVRPGPRRAAPGNPMTFLTTDAFLHHFNLTSLDDLPDAARLREEGVLDATPGIDIGGIPDDLATED
ncbi:SMC-Scp complex subunit ScpB [Rhizobium leguminosarum]|uniref:SMC-Scp complex subunit ScpB n=1 Tax=Rhizobium leguminosarum TaxID=384 RepID=UPI002E112FC0|nr:SMC-Scp complex subunit ScpB [Rhizobium leguminosarum]